MSYEYLYEAVIEASPAPKVVAALEDNVEAAGIVTATIGANAWLARPDSIASHSSLFCFTQAGKCYTRTGSIKINTAKIKLYRVL